MGYERRWSAQTADGHWVIVAKQFRPGRGFRVHRGPMGRRLKVPMGPQHPTGRGTYVAVCEVSSGKRVAKLPHDAFRMTLSGSWLAVSGGSPERVTVYRVGRRRGSSSAVRHVKTLKHGLGIGAATLRFSPTRRFLAVGTPYGRVEVYDTRTWRCRSRFTVPHKRRLESLGFFPKRPWLLTGDDRAHLDLWRISDGKRLGRVTLRHRPDPPRRKLIFSRQVSSLHVSPDGSRLVVGMDLSGAHVRLYRIAE